MAPSRGRAHGAALMIGLALLLVLTLLALISVRGSRLDAGRAASGIAARTAFEAAERGLRAALALGAPAAAGGVLSGTVGDTGDGGRASYRFEPDRSRAATDVPSGFSLGAEVGFRAHRYQVSAIGTAEGRRVGLRQEILVVGPPGE